MHPEHSHHQQRLIAWLLAAAALLAMPTAAGTRPATSREVAPALRAIHRQHRRFHARLREASALFVGAPYALSPLGEGPDGEVDRDPLVRFDRFDCVTYVEEVMALAWHADLAQASATLQRIRYARGEVRYGARNHLMLAQWLPRNLAEGFVHDVTATVAKGAAGEASIELREEDFLSAEGKKLALAPADRPLGGHRVPMIPRAHMPALLERVPDGTVITTVRARRAGVPYRASHVGLVLQLASGPVVRHAHAPSGRVVEEPLARFVARAGRRARWPVSGFHLARVAERPPPPRGDRERSNGP